MMPRMPPAAAMLLDLQAERAAATIDEHDLAGEFARQRTGLAPAASAQPRRLPPSRRVEHRDRSLDGGGQRSRPGLEHRAALRRRRQRGHGHQLQRRRRHRRLRHAQRRRGSRRRAGDELLVGAVAGRGDGQHAHLRGVVDRFGQVIVERLAVRRTQRHVDDVDAVANAAVAVRIEREVHAPGSARRRCTKSRARSRP